jgi:hypothetical protein
MVWIALIVSNVGGALKGSGQTLQAAKSAVDKAAATGTAPDFSFLPGATMPNKVTANAEMTFWCVTSPSYPGLPCPTK